MGAALFLGETVGWRRWSAIIIGLIGVLLIIRPGFEAFDPLSLLALVGVIGLSGRDLVTRAMPPGISSAKLAIYAFVTLVPTGWLLLAVQGQSNVMPGTADSWRLVASVFLGIAAYYTIVLATRIGDLSAISPFRYSRLVFALIVGAIAFGERPDALTLLGSAIIVGSGLYALLRESRLRGTSPSS